MKLLAIETATEACSAALLYEGRLLCRAEAGTPDSARQHSRMILPMMQSLLSEAGLTLKQLDALAFGRGPGSFTGARLAASVVQGAALALNIPVVPISTLRALAQGAYRETGATHVAAALDARLSQVYWGTYRLAEEGVMAACGPEIVCCPEDAPFAEFKDAEKWLGVGSGWDRYHSVLQQRTGMRRWLLQRYPHAQDIAVLACYEYDQGCRLSAEDIAPVYVRDSVAQHSVFSPLPQGGEPTRGGGQG